MLRIFTHILISCPSSPTSHLMITEPSTWKGRGYSWSDLSWRNRGRASLRGALIVLDQLAWPKAGCCLFVTVSSWVKENIFVARKNVIIHHFFGTLSTHKAGAGWGFQYPPWWLAKEPVVVKLLRKRNLEERSWANLLPACPVVVRLRMITWIPHIPMVPPLNASNLVVYQLSPAMVGRIPIMWEALKINMSSSLTSYNPQHFVIVVCLHDSKSIIIIIIKWFIITFPIVLGILWLLNHRQQPMAPTSFCCSATALGSRRRSGTGADGASAKWDRPL